MIHADLHTGMVSGPEGFEPSTSGSAGSHSIHAEL